MEVTLGWIVAYPALSSPEVISLLEVGARAFTSIFFAMKLVFLSKENYNRN